MIEGQITRTQVFGDLLYKYAQSPKIKSIVEIGTWTGMGSTKCIIDGLLTRQDEYSFTSIELYPDQYKDAVVNLKPYMNPNIKLLNGKIIEYDEALWFDHSIINMSTDGHAKLWYQKDMDYLKTQPNVLAQLPEKIDLLVLDGGEYTTYPEYKKLKDRCRIIALDDTNIFKCKKIREELLNEKHRVVCDNIYERHGWSIFELKK